MQPDKVPEPVSVKSPEPKKRGFVFGDMGIQSPFIAGEAVFKITSTGPDGKVRDVTIVTTRNDYEKKLMTHRYDPIMFLAPFYIKVAYLYNCLNYEYSRSRPDTYVFWWRLIGEKDWRCWFTLLPYLDNKF